jgi:predicted lipoprotein with Yx(FWY)xxD motif
MKIFIAVAVVGLMVAGAWWWMEHPDSLAHLPNPIPVSPSAQDTHAYTPGNLLLGLDSSDTLGKYLIGSNGMTLYVFARDPSNASNCTGLCTRVWPPYTIASRDALENIQAGIQGRVGVITREDGSMQVTYDEQPLYFSNQDQVSGDTKGDGIGNVWSVAKP